MSTAAELTPALRSAVRGRVLTPGDAGYDDARALFAGGMDRHPASIVRPAGADDVVGVVRAVGEAGLPLAVRGGGHSAVGHSVIDDAVVLDLRDMRALDIDVDGRTAWAQTGLTAGEYTAAAAEHGLATGFGDTGSVGIGGITLGGGIGFLVRKYGMTIYDLLAAEIVTADGQARQVDRAHDPDLFWAIRGGGGNFGVATRLRFRLHEVATVVGGILILPATADTIASFIGEALAAPDELSTIANVMPAPPMPFVPEELHGTPVILGMLTYAGDTEAGERAVAPFRAIAPPIADMLRPMTYPEMYMPDEGDYHPISSVRSAFVDDIDVSSAGTILEHLDASTAQMAVAQLRVLGGAMARVPADATAFAHRDRGIMVNVATIYERSEDRPEHEAWVEGLAAAIRRGERGAYVNFLGDEGQARIREAYPDATWDRLSAIKARYDPSNVFRYNQNIPPAT
jgi:FAD/FMN-containing dehydrogenase